ncbi:VWA domain-containing protein [Methanospirillum hungatei]|uniref:VWA domain-containing protein n=1 Tax=Methanospirillum hungatei TaxID=2203 RepID=UPI0026F202E3|nr:VWA domain-containing protein [Methanospirillum hungatei]MCA1917339.1 VWA domain-containing protein [Methanospirillum hungatei]
MFHEHEYFADIKGLNEAKLSLLLFLVSPAIRSLILIGGTGTGKSHLARLATSVTDQKTVHLPQHATWDRVFGSIDFTASLARGEEVIEHGLLKRADGGIVIMDDIHLMDHTLITAVLTAAETGTVIIERDGISSIYQTNFKIIATLNQEEGEITPHIIDRFSLCALCPAITDPFLRKQFLKEAIGRNPYYSIPDLKCSEKENNQREQILKAQNRYPYVHIPDGIMDLVTSLAIDLGVEGHRGDIAHCSAASALAALNERDQVSVDDISATLQVSLQHRRRDYQKESPSLHDTEKKQSSLPECESKKDEDGLPQNNHPQKEDQNESQQKQIPQAPAPDQVFAVGDMQFTKDLISQKKNRNFCPMGKTGKKGSHQNISYNGRYFRSKHPSGKIYDIAFDATFRAAAPHQIARSNGTLALNISVQDIRVKERKRKSGRTIIFVVDSSGSMGAAKRMIAVKGAVLSLLKDAYINRDQVALISFRGTGAEVLLKPTRSGMTAYHQLAHLPTGGLTPLSSGIYTAVSLIRTIRRKNSHDEPFVIIISDGRANHARSGNDPVSEAWMAAAAARNEKAHYYVIDTECGYPRFYLAKKLAEHIGGTYTLLETMNGEEIVQFVRQESGRQTKY